MKSLITEFSFGFALTNELVERYSSDQTGAPLFLNQYQEGQVGGGFDVELRAAQPIFLQFKLSDYLKRSTAKDAPDLGVPHFRFHIRSPENSPQHQLLLDLESRYPDVYYAAPRFYLPEELDAAFLAKDVVTRTAFMRPSEVGPIIDGREHTVAFRQMGFEGIYRSEPQKAELVDFEAQGRQSIAVRLSQTTVRRSISELNRDVAQSVLDIAKRRNSKVSRDLEGIEESLADEKSQSAIARYLSMNLLGCELLYALGPRDAT